MTARDAAERDAQLASRDEELKRKQLKIDQLTHEMATLKRWRYARRSEQLDAVQRSLLDESIDADLEAISLEIEALQGKPLLGAEGTTAPRGAACERSRAGRSVTSPSIRSAAAAARSSASARM